MAANSSDTQTSTTKPQGVYRNPRLMHACTTIVGTAVHLQTKDGSIWEGVFNTFSPEFTICLDYAIQIDSKLLNTKGCLYSALKSGSQVEKQAFFDLKDIVRMTARDIDLNYATKEVITKLATDSDISGYDPSKSVSFGEQRELESWQDDDGDEANEDTMLSLDDVGLEINKNDSNKNDSRGWDAKEMFRYNEQHHHVTSTYDEKLTSYTLPLPKHSTKEWRKKQERATAIAREIEGNTKSRNRLAKEDNDDCEEEKFSAVLRPPPSNLRPRFERNNRINSLKNFGKRLTLAPSPRPPQDNQPEKAKQVTPSPSPRSSQDNQTEQAKPVTPAPAPPSAPTPAPASAPASTPATESSPKPNQQPQDNHPDQDKDPRIELARRSKLNPNAKEFKPSSMTPTLNAPYYQPVPMNPTNLPLQQQHPAPHFIQDPHPHFHYTPPVHPPFPQQMPQRYIRNNFPNYLGEHHNYIRIDYSQAPMMAPTSTGQPYVPPPLGPPIYFYTFN